MRAAGFVGPVDAALRAAAGLGLVALAALGWLALTIAGGLNTFTAGVATVSAGAALAAVGVVALSRRGPGTLGAGFGLAGVGGAVLVADFFTGFGAYSVGILVVGVALFQASWFAVLWAFEGERGLRRVGGLRLSLAFAAAGPALFVLLNLTDGSVLWLGPNVLATLGFVLAASSLAAPAPA